MQKNIALKLNKMLYECEHLCHTALQARTVVKNLLYRLCKYLQICKYNKMIDLKNI